MKAELLKLGFTLNEIKVYTALLELGQTSTGPLIKKTGLHRNIVYDVLDGLTKEKLVSEALKSGKKYFRLRSPETLLEKAHERLEASHKIANEVKKRLGAARPEVIVYEGTEGWQTANRYLADRLKKNDTICTLGVGGDRWVEAMGDYFITWENFLKKNKIKNRMVAHEWQRKEIEAHQASPMRETKYLSEKFSMPANTEIFKDGIFIQIYTTPLILIEVRSAEVAKSYRQYFEVMWKLAKK